MPRRRDRRLSNGCYRKKPYRNTQREYRLTRGLTSNNVTLRLCFQTEITHAILARKSILHNATNLLLASHLANTDMQKTYFLMNQWIFLCWTLIYFDT